MTTKELIAKLDAMGLPDAEVRIEGCDCSGTACHVEIYTPRSFTEAGGFHDEAAEIYICREDCCREHKKGRRP